MLKSTTPNVNFVDVCLDSQRIPNCVILICCYTNIIYNTDTYAKHYISFKRSLFHEAAALLSIIQGPIWRPIQFNELMNVLFTFQGIPWIPLYRTCCLANPDDPGEPHLHITTEPIKTRSQLIVIFSTFFFFFLGHSSLSGHQKRIDSPPLLYYYLLSSSCKT